MSKDTRLDALHRSATLSIKIALERLEKVDPKMIGSGMSELIEVLHALTDAEEKLHTLIQVQYEG